MTQKTSNDNNAQNPQVFSHTTRPNWGYAIELWERDGRRCLQFEDKQTRVFKEGYYHFLQEADLPFGELQEIIHRLDRTIALRMAADRINHGQRILPLVQQVAYFKEEFAKGFRDKTWVSKYRGLNAKRKAKRHKNTAIKAAQAAFAKDVLRKRIEEEDWDGMRDDIQEVLSDTSLITKTHTKQLDNLSEEGTRRLMTSLLDLLSNPEDKAACFGKWLRAMRTASGTEPSWELATTLPALIQPKQHVAVKRTTFERQAAWLSPQFVMSDRASVSAYERLLTMMERLGDKMAEYELKPSDNLDLRDFIDLTMRPKTYKALLKRKTPAAAKRTRAKPQLSAKDKASDSAASGREVAAA